MFISKCNNLKTQKISPRYIHKLFPPYSIKKILKITKKLTVISRIFFCSFIHTFSFLIQKGRYNNYSMTKTIAGDGVISLRQSVLHLDLKVVI